MKCIRGQTAHSAEMNRNSEWPTASRRKKEKTTESERERENVETK